ncbi:MAG TPA: dihydroneopterin aldolase [Candidatus Alistipes merdigallinarum]|nr:dihydroneopterin aldolase [Candidatus Alistipes merdigallinarum]
MSIKLPRLLHSETGISRSLYYNQNIPIVNLSTIELEEMEFRAFHGCYPLERIVGNRFLVNVAIKADLSLPAASDNVDDTINYLSVYETVRDEMAVESHILEHVAQRIIDAIYRRFPQSQHIRVKVSKLAPPLGGKIKKVSVTLEK